VQVTLTKRQQQILWATVRHYVVTAEPVGSKALVEEYNLSVSPATIRSAMNCLERSGLLYQPHPSAGRIPSDYGYRIYVDQLMQPAEAPSWKMEQALSHQLKGDSWSLEALLRGAAQLLANLSGYIALVTMPQTQATYLRHVQLVQIDPHRVMLIVVTDACETRSILLELPPSVLNITAESGGEEVETMAQELQILSNFLSQHFRGRSLQELALLDWSTLDNAFEKYADFLRTLITHLRRHCTPTIAPQFLINGVSEVLRQPEFSELNQVRALMQLLEEEQEQIHQLVLGDPSSFNPTERRVTVRIGSENSLEPLQTCALVFAPYQRGQVSVGCVGLLGPTRMMYENAIAIVETTADYLSEALN